MSRGTHLTSLTKHQRLQTQSERQVWLSRLALVMMFFVLPYVADVPYLDDHTSTHDAEENIKTDPKTEPKHDAFVQFFAYAQYDSVGEHSHTPQKAYKRIDFPPKETSSFQRCFHVSLISRPPPIT